MKVWLAAHTDIGIQKKMNQDSLLVEEAQTGNGRIIFAVLCDGMGGLSKGELASAVVITAFQEWFHTRMPQLLRMNLSRKQIKKEWKMLLQEQNQRIADYARRNRLQMGTTLLAILITEQFYLLMNVGDSRCYWIGDGIYQMTKDHTYVQREVDMGRLHQKEAEQHPGRNILLQCVGASEIIMPDYFVGEIQKDIVFLLCSDGFRHEITNYEMYQYLCSGFLTSEEMMNDNLRLLTEIAKQRGERDNISSIAICIC